MDVLLRALVPRRAAARAGRQPDLVGLALFAIVLRRALWNRDGVVTSLRVSPGERLLISVTDPRAPQTVVRPFEP